MPYFDALSYVGIGSFHCTGLHGTAKLLREALAVDGTKILEIGCGTGTTTQALLAAGYDLTVVEPNTRMLKAMLRNATSIVGRSPAFYCAKAEEMSAVPGNTYDVALLECVFGFIQSKHDAIKQISRCLKPGGRVAIIDFHYVSDPPDHLMHELKSAGIFETLFREDWETYFSAFRLENWCDIALSAPAAMDSEMIRRGIRDVGQPVDGVAENLVVEAVMHRLANWEPTFLANRKYMRGHRAVWSRL
jgi:SAM-dependent methyltransferase